MRIILFGTFLAICAPAPALAQTAAVPEEVGVADRPRPEYQPIGGRLGSFFLYPTLSVSAEASDNIRATTTDRNGDVDVVLGARARVQSIFSRHALNLDAYGEQRLYANNTSENLGRFGAQIDGRYDISLDTMLSALVSFDHDAEARTSYNTPLGALEPVRFDRLAAAVSLDQSLGRFNLTGKVAFRKATYDDVALASGAVQDQSYRDVDVVSGSLAVRYRVREGMGLILRGTADSFNATLPANDPLQPGNLDRDSNGIRIEGGLRFDLTSLLYGEIRVGYLKRDYNDPRLRDASGVSFGADLLWNVTTLTTLRFSADRRIEESASTTTVGNRTTDFSASVDHELLRNLILSTGVRYVMIDPLGAEGSSDEFYANAGARLRISRQLSFRAGYRYSQRTSSVTGRDYTENRGYLTVHLTL